MDLEWHVVDAPWWLRHEVDVRFPRGDWHVSVQYMEHELVGDLIRRLARQHGVVNGVLALEDWGTRPRTVLAGHDRIPGGGVLYVYARRPEPAPLVSMSLYVEADGQVGTIPVLTPVAWPPEELDPIVLALSGTGATPDYWALATTQGQGEPARPRRLRRETPIVLQLTSCTDVVLTWTFAVERHVQWAVDRRHWRPAILGRAQQAQGVPDLDPPPLFWGAQMDLAPEFFHRDLSEPSPRPAPTAT